MVGAEMLTNEREEYQMTPGDWEGGTEQKVTQCCLKVLYWLCFLSRSLSLSLSISIKGSLRGLSKHHPLLIRKSLINTFLSINTHI